MEVARKWMKVIRMSRNTRLNQIAMMMSQRTRSFLRPKMRQARVQQAPQTICKLSHQCLRHLERAVVREVVDMVDVGVVGEVLEGVEDSALLR